MKRRELKRLSAVLLSVIFVLSLIFSFSFIVSEADHDCSGENCEICQLIDFCLDQIAGYVPLVIACATAVAVYGYFSSRTVSLLSDYKRTTQVMLKTRLNN